MSSSRCPASLYFNPRSREGSDFIFVEGLFQLTLFQSTLPRRERRKRALWRFDRFYFNPRSREGSDAFFCSSFMVCNISIHAPAKGATSDISICWHRIIISIHAPAKGATARKKEEITYYPISIHAPAKGATKDFAVEWFINRFQSTLPRRERQRKVAPFMAKID